MKLAKAGGSVASSMSWVERRMSIDIAKAGSSRPAMRFGKAGMLILSAAHVQARPPKCSRSTINS